MPHNTHCRILNTVFDQGECGACLVFALVTAQSMRLCMGGVDFIPSPYRIFDCLSTCNGTGATPRGAFGLLRRGVEDLDSSPKVFGLPCGRWTFGLHFVGSITDPKRIRRELQQRGPLVAMVDWDDTFYRHRGHGIWRRTGPRLDKRHSVVLLDWRPYPEPHYLIQNSWGEWWGFHGRARVAEASITWAFDDGIESVAIIYVLETIIFITTFALLALLRRKGHHNDVAREVLDPLDEA